MVTQQAPHEERPRARDNHCLSIVFFILRVLASEKGRYGNEIDRPLAQLDDLTNHHFGATNSEQHLAGNDGNIME